MRSQSHFEKSKGKIPTIPTYQNVKVARRKAGRLLIV